MTGLQALGRRIRRPWGRHPVPRPVHPATAGCAAVRSPLAKQHLVHQHYGVGNRPTSLAVGDVNGDSVADLAVSNFRDNNVGVLLGNGDGSFQKPPPDIVPLLTTDPCKLLLTQSGYAVAPHSLGAERDSLTSGKSVATVGQQPMAARLSDSLNRDGVDTLFEDFAPQGWKELVHDRPSLAEPPLG